VQSREGGKYYIYERSMRIKDVEFARNENMRRWESAVAVVDEMISSERLYVVFLRAFILVSCC
jgi:hypothetical protein